MEILDWIKTVVDKLGALFPGVNMALVLGLILVLLIVRAVDRPVPKKGKVKRLGNGAYALLVAVLAFALAVVDVRPFDWRTWIGSGIKHAGAASILYQLAKTILPEKLFGVTINPDKSWITRPKA